MALATIKKEFKNTRVAFGKSAAPLGYRDDIDQLAIIAHESKNQSLLKLFEKLPELSVLKKAKTELELKRPVAVNPELVIDKGRAKPRNNRIQSKNEEPK